MGRSDEIHARVATYTVKSGFLEIVVQRIRETFPALERQDGFLGMAVLSDEKASTVVSTCMWQNRDKMLSSERDEMFQDVISRVITLLKGPPQFRHCRLEALS